MKDFEPIIQVSFKMSETDKDVPLYGCGVSPFLRTVFSKLPPKDLADMKKDILETISEALDKIGTLNTDFQKALNEAEGH